MENFTAHQLFTLGRLAGEFDAYADEVTENYVVLRTSSPLRANALGADLAADARFGEFAAVADARLVTIVLRDYDAEADPCFEVATIYRTGSAPVYNGSN